MAQGAGHMAAGSPGCLGVQTPAGHWERVAAAARDPDPKRNADVVMKKVWESFLESEC